MKFNLTKYKILFIIILFIAIAFRMFSWPTAISQINSDEAMTALNAKTIAESGKDMYGTSFPVYLEAWGSMGQSVMLMYFMAFFIKLFGFSMITVRLPMLIISIVSIIVFYCLVDKIFGNKKLSLFAMAFVSICPWHLLQSIWSIDCNMFPHFMLISVYLLYIGINKKWSLYLSMFFFALTMYTYGVSIYIVPFFLLICAIYLLVKKKITIKDLIVCIVIYLLFSVPILTMYFINALKIDTTIHIGPMTIQYFSANSRTGDMLFFSQNIGHTFINNLKCLVLTFLVQYDGLEWNGTRIFGTVYHISLIFFFIGIIYLMRHKEDRNDGTFLWGIWLILSIILGLIINEVNINRLNIIWFPTLFFSVYGIYVVCKNRKILKYGLSIIYITLFVSFSVYLYSTHTSAIDMSGCFSRKVLDAVHYASSTLEKSVVYYCNVPSIYVRFQDALDDIPSEHVSDLDVFANRLENKKDDEAFVIMSSELDSSTINVDNYNYERFGEAFVIY